MHYELPLHAQQSQSSAHPHPLLLCVPAARRISRLVMHQGMAPVVQDLDTSRVMPVRASVACALLLGFDLRASHADDSQGCSHRV